MSHAGASDGYREGQPRVTASSSAAPRAWAPSNTSSCRHPPSGNPRSSRKIWAATRNPSVSIVGGQSWGRSARRASGPACSRRTTTRRSAGGRPWAQRQRVASRPRRSARPSPFSNPPGSSPGRSAQAQGPASRGFTSVTTATRAPYRCWTRAPRAMSRSNPRPTSACVAKGEAATSRASRDAGTAALNTDISHCTRTSDKLADIVRRDASVQRPHLPTASDAPTSTFSTLPA